ncbi:MAG: hydrogenase formation protein HypD [Candidatus Korarchaeota archaeon]
MSNYKSIFITLTPTNWSLGVNMSIDWTKMRRTLQAYRNRELVKTYVEKIHQMKRKIEAEVTSEPLKIMNFCGTHEFTVTYYGLRSLMPDGVELVAGPGCPVCVTPAREIDEAIEISYLAAVITYGDMYKVPGTKISLAEAKAAGGKVHVVYGFRDAVELASSQPDKDFVFFAVGFETTAPSVASYIVENKIPKNLYLLASYRITVPIMRYILESKMHKLHGIIAPGHVSTIVGASSWRFVPEEFNVPLVVAGFEPLDVIIAIYEIMQQIYERKPRLVNEYSRVVTWHGNLKAKSYISKAFDAVDGSWRGIGIVPQSVWRLNKEYSEIDARKKYGVNIEHAVDIKPGCKCAEVTLGLAKPTDCKYFGKACTPEHPIGPCMVSSEGACSIWFKYGGYESIKARSYS